VCATLHFGTVLLASRRPSHHCGAVGASSRGQWVDADARVAPAKVTMAGVDAALVWPWMNAARAASPVRGPAGRTSASTPVTRAEYPAASAHPAIAIPVDGQYREPFDRLLDSPEARAELGDLDVTPASAQLLGPLIFAVMTGIRTIDRADCEKIVDDFYAAHRGTTGARQRR